MSRLSKRRRREREKLRAFAREFYEAIGERDDWLATAARRLATRSGVPLDRWEYSPETRAAWLEIARRLDDAGGDPLVFRDDLLASGLPFNWGRVPGEPLFGPVPLP